MDTKFKCPPPSSEYLKQKEWIKKRMEQQEMRWQPIETKPDNTHVLVHYKNSLGKSRIVKARWIPKYTEENSEGEFCDYHEERDTYYDPEGWYEAIDNWPDYSHVAFCEGEPDAWMPLPNPPTESDNQS